MEVERPLRNGSHRTAVVRKDLSAPMSWLWENGLIWRALWRGRRGLDYGCGRGQDAEWFSFDRYDPAWFPEPPRRKYDVVTCVYVLNVVSASTARRILVRIRGLLRPGGVAYVAVRRDIPEYPRLGGREIPGYSRRVGGWVQRQVYLKLPKVHENSRFCIYEVRP